MIGRRIYPTPGPGTVFAPGDYGKLSTTWHACTPSGALGNLANHTVVEHEDGTITVSPSILVTDGAASWHGWLERGVWREC